ncbi:MAG: hypothetical protein VX899_17905 [Myxococcota bacterium]|nr:hypothetical protein [Myxococcota bacterium]
MSDSNRFRFWVRRGSGDDPTFSVRFDVRNGKGLLRVARPGVLVDPPARQSGFEERLTPAQVRASRFLHIWDSGRKRQGYVLSRLSDELLLPLAPERWVELGIESDGGFSWLVPRTDEPEPYDSVEPSEPQNDDPTESGEPTNPDGGAAPPPVNFTGGFGRATTLIRHLRRQNGRDQEKIQALEQRVHDLEKKLEAARKREVQLRTRVARYQRRLKARESVTQK